MTLERTRLVPKTIKKDLEPWLIEQIENFESLDYPAGVGAANWLRDHIKDPSGPFETIITSEARKMLGFTATVCKRVTVPPTRASRLGWRCPGSPAAPPRRKVSAAI